MKLNRIPSIIILYQISKDISLASQYFTQILLKQLSK